MRRHARAAGLDDAIIVNTCAVTGEAVRQAAQTVRRLRREARCSHHRDRMRGADRARAFCRHVRSRLRRRQHREDEGRDDPRACRLPGASGLQVNDIMSVRETALHMIDGVRSHTRAYVQIQNGCDHRCTFCIIPFGRGPSRSVAAGEIVKQVRKLVERGCAEIVLTGVDITSYGRDLPGSPTLGRLVRQVLKHVPELARLRLSSIDQVEADADLMIALGEEERLMPHLHLSLQAGDDLTLKRMKRRHLRSDAIAFCERARALRPDIVFGADLIAGFPTETDDMFENSHSIVDQCGLTYLHVFHFRYGAGRLQHACRKCRRASSRSGPQNFVTKEAPCSPHISKASAVGLSTCWLKTAARAARRSLRKSSCRANVRAASERSCGHRSREPKRERFGRRGLRVSEPREKSKGIFGRLFKGASHSSSEEEEKAAIAEVPAVDDDVAEPEPAKQSWFQRLKSGLGKTSSKLTSGITDLFSKRKLDAGTLEDLEDLLIQSDLGLETTSRITAAIGKGRFEKESPAKRCAASWRRRSNAC